MRGSFTATQTTDLFSPQLSGGDERNLTGMNGAGYVGVAKVSKDGKWIVYIVRIDGRQDLRVSDGNPAQPPPSSTPVPSPTPTTTPSARNVYLPVVIK